METSPTVIRPSVSSWGSEKWNRFRRYLVSALSFPRQQATAGVPRERLKKE